MNKWIEEFAGFASQNRRRIAAEGKLNGGCRAAAVEPRHTENFFKRYKSLSGLRYALRRAICPLSAIYACGVRYVGGAAALFPL